METMTDLEHWKKIRNDLLSEIAFWPTESEAKALGVPHMSAMLPAKIEALNKVNATIAELEREPK